MNGTKHPRDNRGSRKTHWLRDGRLENRRPEIKKFNLRQELKSWDESKESEEWPTPAEIEEGVVEESDLHWELGYGDFTIRPRPLYLIEEDYDAALYQRQYQLLPKGYREYLDPDEAWHSLVDLRKEYEIDERLFYQDQGDSAIYEPYKGRQSIESACWYAITLAKAQVWGRFNQK